MTRPSRRTNDEAKRTVFGSAPRMPNSDTPPFDVTARVIGIQASGELAIVMPPGTGKTTTSVFPWSSRVFGARLPITPLRVAC